jgi:hypothetical protein
MPRSGKSKSAWSLVPVPSGVNWMRSVPPAKSPARNELVDLGHAEHLELLAHTALAGALVEDRVLDALVDAVLDVVAHVEEVRAADVDRTLRDTSYFTTRIENSGVFKAA